MMMVKEQFLASEARASWDDESGCECFVSAAALFACQRLFLLIISIWTFA